MNNYYVTIEFENGETREITIKASGHEYAKSEGMNVTIQGIRAARIVCCCKC